MTAPTEKQKIAELRAKGKPQSWIDSYMRKWREVGQRAQKQKGKL